LEVHASFCTRVLASGRHDDSETEASNSSVAVFQHLTRYYFTHHELLRLIAHLIHVAVCPSWNSDQCRTLSLREWGRARLMVGLNGVSYGRRAYVNTDYTRCVAGGQWRGVVTGIYDQLAGVVA